MYIRFVVGNDGDNHRRLFGVVTQAALLQFDGDLEPYEDTLVQEAFDWLNSNLPCPPFEPEIQAGNWPKRVVSWFKSNSPEAQESIRVMRTLALVLENHGKSILVLRSPNPGKIHYEDDFQIVVEDFKHLPKTSGPKR